MNRKFLFAFALTLLVCVAKYTQAANESISKIKFNATPSSKFIGGFVVGYASQQWIYQDINDYGSPIRVKYPLDNTSSRLYTPTFMLGVDFYPEFKYGIGLRTGFLFDFLYYYKKSEQSNTIIGGLNIPLHLSYRYEIIKDFSLFFQTGPTFNILAISQFQGHHNPYYEHYSFNALWAVTGGVRYKRFQLSVGGEFNLSTIVFGGYHYSSYIKLKKPIVLSFSILFGQR